MDHRSFTQTPDSVLARIANKIYIELGLDAAKLKTLVYRFVRSFQSGNQLKYYYTKVNLYNELTKDKMSFKVFMKLLTVLNIKKITFNITLITYSDHEITVTEEIQLSNMFRKAEEGENAEDESEGDSHASSV